MSDQTAPQTAASPTPTAPQPLCVSDAMHRRAVSIGAHDTLADAVVTMQELRVKRLPVLQGGKVIGILTDGEVRRSLPPLSEGLTPWDFAGRVGRTRVREVMRQPAHTVTPETPLATAIHTMLERHIGGLPVVNGDGELLGMLTLTDVLRAEARTPRLRWGAVEQHMTVDVVCTPADAPAQEAAAKLKISRLRVLPVLEGKALAGLLHEVDLADAVDRASADHGDTVMGNQFFLQGKTARDLMRPPTGHLRAGTPMRDALTQMLALDVHGLPIVDDEGELLGVVTISDVLKTVMGQANEG
ncbi:CBS domain-containing protein [Deinococcus arenicola]|uniref:CBS domain-containing protein n=1 Tax=Deinococcus arenicola TaxID=2994950 RepID=A0ABU4DL68_9DEIO|nr:CBS domain-containing protein [Deinococcus sp. ZS9-10]MDV6373170.1 CBS domain-containing protein [Deinococcus sp. ZS9-10]